jgi:TRAP transporter TAXI family solute receptor
MRRKLLSALGALALSLVSAAAIAAVEYKIVTAFERGTYFRAGRDLAEFIAPAADIDLEALPSAGSGENVRRLRYEPGVKLALVQSDVYQAFLDQAAAGNSEARDMIRPLRVIMPLFNSEAYFIVRQDSPLNYVHEIRDARINVSERGSGTALTATTLYRLMFNTPIPEAKTSYLSNEDALVKLTTEKSVDVVAVNAGQPAKLLADMKPEARRLIKLLKFDADQPASRAALKTYVATTVQASNYPNLLSEDIPALAVKAYLVTYDFSLKATETSLRRFARSLCQNFSLLQEKGHPKWSEVEPGLPDLGRGWVYYAPAASELRSCLAARSRPKPVAAPKPCSQQEEALGLCKAP